MDSNVFIFNGFSGQVYEKIKKHYKGPKYNLIFAAEKSPRRFHDILERTLSISLKNPTAVILFSCREEDPSTEKKWFFPWTFRVPLDRSLATDTGQFSRLIEQIDCGIKSFKDSDVVNSVRRRSDKRFLLPIRNSNIKALSDSFDDIFFRGLNLNGAAKRNIKKVRKKNQIKIGNLTFEYSINSTVHPVRRVTDSDLCDLQARFRFGVPIPSSFEFDVSCESGLKGKVFSQCCGSKQPISGSPSHLNMRINDDFKYR